MNNFLADLRREREARRPANDGSPANQQTPEREPLHEPEAPKNWRTAEEPQGKKQKASSSTSGAEVIDLIDSDDEPSSCMPCADDATIAAEWQKQEYALLEKQDLSDAAIAAKFQQDEYAALATHGAMHGDQPSSTDVAGAPWPAEVSWFEYQHRPGRCGNFDTCSSGSSSFVAVTRANGVPYRDSTAHGKDCLPRPMPGQRLTLSYLPHAADIDVDLGADAKLGLRKGKLELAFGGQRVMRPGLDGTVQTIIARTPSYTAFGMPSFAGHLEVIPLGPSGEKAFLLRNFDGTRGATLAARLEAAFGLDIVDPPSGKGTDAKCAAAQVCVLARSESLSDKSFPSHSHSHSPVPTLCLPLTTLPTSSRPTYVYPTCRAGQQLPRYLHEALPAAHVPGASPRPSLATPPRHHRRRQCLLLRLCLLLSRRAATAQPEPRQERGSSRGG